MVGKAKKIHKVSSYCAQGDMLLIKVDKIPDGAKPRKAENGLHVLAHSETGHHHAVEDGVGVGVLAEPNNDMVCYLKIEGDYADVVHYRNYDTHETIRLLQGDWMIKRQREAVPEGWRRVED